jgi:hypothetical protein
VGWEMREGGMGGERKDTDIWRYNPPPRVQNSTDSAILRC